MISSIKGKSELTRIIPVVDCQEIRRTEGAKRRISYVENLAADNNNIISKLQLFVSIIRCQKSSGIRKSKTIILRL